MNIESFSFKGFWLQGFIRC